MTLMGGTEERATKFVLPWHRIMTGESCMILKVGWATLLYHLHISTDLFCHRVIDFHTLKDIPLLERKKFPMFLTSGSITSNEQSDLAHTLSKMMCMPRCSLFKETAFCFKNKMVEIGNLTACSKQFSAFPAVNQGHGFLS